MKKIIMTAAVVAALGASAITDDEIGKLIGEMTLDEKIGQMVQLGSGGNQTAGAESRDASEGKLPADVVEWIRKGQVGSLIGACGVEKFNAFQKIAMTEARVKIPLMVGHDMVHGCRTQWPIAPMLACSWDEELWEKCGRITALETPSKGCNWTFAPMVDIARDARWGRIAEGCGQDPLVASRMCAALTDVLTGKVNPEGRLVVEMPRSTGQMPLFYNRLPSSRVRSASSAVGRSLRSLPARRSVRRSSCRYRSSPTGRRTSSFLRRGSSTAGFAAILPAAKRFLSNYDIISNKFCRTDNKQRRKNHGS